MFQLLRKLQQPIDMPIIIRFFDDFMYDFASEFALSNPKSRLLALIPEIWCYYTSFVTWLATNIIAEI